MVTSENLNRWMKYLSQDNNIRAVVIQAPALVQELCDAHEVRGKSSIAFGESILAALLLASSCKLGERVNLQIDGAGYFKKAFIEATPEGATRGYFFQNISADGLWEAGFFSVLRTRSEKAFQPYVGTVPIKNNNIADTLDDYWNQSEQVVTGVGLFVSETENSIQRAGGVLIQALGSADVLCRKQVKKATNKIKLNAKSYAIGSDLEIEKLLFDDFAGLNFRQLESKKLLFQCNCSIEKIESAILIVNDSEILDEAQKKGKIEMTCDLCSKKYSVQWDRVVELINSCK